MREFNMSFDYETLARKYNIPFNVLEQLIKDASAEFPYDQMLAELHVVRALRALARKKVH